MVVGFGWGVGCGVSGDYKWKLSPHPQDSLMLGFVKTNLELEDRMLVSGVFTTWVRRSGGLFRKIM